MSKFNQKTSTKTVNLAGGESYSQSPELELISILLTSFAKDQFYQKEEKSFDRLQNLLNRVNLEFAAKAIIFARTKYGMRSISHIGAAYIAPLAKGKEWAKDFYKQVIHRPDDITEILSIVNGKLSHAMRKGFAEAFNKFDEYQLAKYKGNGKAVGLVDAANIVHPKGVDNKEALTKLIKGELKSVDTWEAKLSSAGQADTDEQRQEQKSEAWKELIETGKIGYFALLRNLRNIIEQSPDAIDKALGLLASENLIKKSLVLPFRFTTAYEEIQKLSNGKIVRDVLIALNKALDISVNNVPKFDGETLIVLDESGSMGGRPAQIGALFSAILVKSNNADLVTFSNDARYRNVNPMDSTITIAGSINFNHGGTDFHSIFRILNKPYDRIIILSDMQGWIGYHAPTKEYNDYRKAYETNPFVYSFDLQGYGSMQFPESNVFCLAGFIY